METDGRAGRNALALATIVALLAAGLASAILYSYPPFAARELARLGEADRLAGLVLIAPAVDFTETLMWERMDGETRRKILETGRWLRASPYSPEPYAITRALIEEGRAHLLFGDMIRAYCPVHILQGMEDPDVPWRHAMELVHRLSHDPVSVTTIRDGDHRLSRNADIELLIRAVETIA